MARDDKNKRRSPYPPENSSMNLYTDPAYSADSIHGHEEEATDSNLVLDDGAADEATEEKEALDEPVESWGWINNVD